MACDSIRDTLQTSSPAAGGLRRAHNSRRSSSPIVHIGSPAQKWVAKSQDRQRSFRRLLQAQEHVKTKVLQSFTQASPDLARTLFLSASPVDSSNRPEVHEWRTGTSPRSTDPDLISASGPISQAGFAQAPFTVRSSSLRCGVFRIGVPGRV